MQANGFRYWLVGVLWLCQSVFVTAQAENDNTLYQLDIPAQTIEVALQRLARQTGKQLFFSHDQINTLTSKPVTGRYSLEQALQQLLQGTPLTGNLTKSGVIVITLSDEHRADSGRGDTMKGKQSKKQLLAAVIGMFAGSSGVLAQESAVDDKGNVWALEEVVVTAQKREQNLQDVPISISVLDGNELDTKQFQNVNDALKQVSGVTLFSGSIGSAAKISVRGVTASDDLFAGSSTVGYYLDEIPFGLIRSAIVPDPNAYDLQQVEVLRGPQGTLYGASSLNGVVRILTKDANLDDYEFKVRSSLSKTEGGGENYRADAAVNIPLVPGKLAARAVVGYNQLSGWLDKPNQDEYNEGDLSNLRLKINAQPSDRLSLEFLTWIQRDDFDGAPLASSKDSTPVFSDEPVSADYDAYGLIVEYEFDSFTLLSSTNTVDYANESTVDVALGFDELYTEQGGEVISQEVRLTSTSDSVWKWSAGGLYRDADEVLFQTLPNVLPAPIAITDTSESFAVFGEVTRSFMDGALDLTLGLRHFEDDVTFQENIRYDGSDDPLASSDVTFKATTPRVVLNWYANDDLTVYGSYSQGFRSGFEQTGQVQDLLGGLPAVEDDLLTNYELGAKGEAWDQRVRFDFAVYYIDWEDTQQVVVTPITEDGSATLVTPINGENASGMGMDFNIIVVPVENFQLGLNASWNDLTMDEEVASGGGLLFLKGDRLKQSPEYTAGITADYTFAIGRDGYEGNIAGAANYHSELLNHSASDTGIRDLNEGDEILMAGLTFAVRSPDGWDATLFVDNLTDEDGLVMRSTIPTWRSRLRPRTVGLQLEYRY